MLYTDFFASQNKEAKSSAHQRVRIFASQIVCIVADSHYTWITDRNGQKYHPCAAFGTFSKQLLSDRHFLLVSRGVLCNMDDIKCFSSGSCLLSNGQTLPVTLRNAKRLEQTWRDYCFSKTRDQTLEIWFLLFIHKFCFSFILYWLFRIKALNFLYYINIASHTLVG